MPSTREIVDQLWAGKLDTQKIHPIRYLNLEGEEIAEGVFFYKGVASANTIDTGDGLVMLDTGTQQDTAPLHAAVRRWRADVPLRAAVFSHHHVDHIFGVRAFAEEAGTKGWRAPQVYAHRLVSKAFDRYTKTNGWNRAINVRQFALPMDRYRWPETYPRPDVEYEGQITFRAGGLTFELRHARGETDDATWTWIPERGILAAGDLFIWAVPNAGNPQKVQRYAGEWAVALREMAALGPELLLAGHGLPIFGVARIREALEDTAELLDLLETQVVALMNQGAPLDRILHEVHAPEALLAKPYLRPVYDHPQFIVRNIWRLYGGWHDGEPDNLLPAPRAEQAREWVALAGGLEKVLARARALLAEGNARMACHLVEHAVIAEPGSTEAHQLRREAYSARAAGEESSMARNILNHAALSSAEGKRDLAGGW
jgi:alkyl sulfatase BDS1-like metallo-beta-lactamase superfamily hydrolase